ncbi:MAG: hypothetical protein KDK70_13785, partial [Myxococcales bacterium]|nr:hypothetical protein [Myxococcales bacterium]
MRTGRWIIVAVALVPWIGCTDGISVALTKARQGEPVPLCRALCERVSSCEIHADFEGVPACTQACAEREDAWSDQCREPMIALSACELQLSCAQLGALLDPSA